MAGIGQRFSPSDQPASWNSSAQLSMGRTGNHDASNNKLFLNNYQGLSDKRLFEENGDSQIGMFNSRNLYNQPLGTSEKGMLYQQLSEQRRAHSFRNGESSPGDLSGTLSMPPNSLTAPVKPSVHQMMQDQGPILRSPFPGQLVNPFGKMPRRDAPFPGSGGSGSGSTTPVSLDPSEFPSLSTRGGVMGGGLGGSSMMGMGGGMSNLGMNLGGNSSSGMNHTTMLPIGSAPGMTAQLQQGSNLPGSTPLRNYVNVMSKGPTMEQNEFSMQYEDFPALPGAQNPPSSTPSSSSNTSLHQHYLAQQHNSSYMTTTATGQHQQPQQMLPSSNGPPRVQVLDSKTMTNIPKSMIRDPFGMLGLLKLMKVGDLDPNLTLLAPGVDLTVLGVNVTQQMDIYPSFTSPWQEVCVGRPQDMDYHLVPNEYKIRHLISNNLPEPSTEKLTEESLFWLFYNCCGEEAQLAAAKELYKRDWRYHKVRKVWLTRSTESLSTQNVSSGEERGIYLVWNQETLNAQKLTFTLVYAELDTTPGSINKSITFGLPHHHPPGVSLPSQLPLLHQAAAQHH